MSEHTSMMNTLLDAHSDVCPAKMYLMCVQGIAFTGVVCSIAHHMWTTYRKPVCKKLKSWFCRGRPE